MTTDRGQPVLLRPDLANLLFPRDVVAAELHGNGTVAALLPDEAEYIAGAVRKRREEFAAGRSCARLALAALGCDAVPLLVGTDRAPCWPAAVTGSISHTAGYCIAAVARTEKVQAIGVDAECVGAVSEDLWDRVFLDAELEWLQRALPPARAEMATLLFAAKEAFYKYQYALARTWLNFKDVNVSVTPDGFCVVPEKPQLAVSGLHRTFGCYARDENRVLCAIVG